MIVINYIFQDITYTITCDKPISTELDLNNEYEFIFENGTMLVIKKPISPNIDVLQIFERLPDELKNHILSYRPTHSLAKSIQNVIEQKQIITPMIEENLVNRQRDI